jgi:hypothetical protein
VHEEIESVIKEVLGLGLPFRFAMNTKGGKPHYVVTIDTADSSEIELVTELAKGRDLHAQRVGGGIRLLPART